MRGVAEVVREQITAVSDRMSEQIKALEARIDSLPAPKDGIDGKDAAPVDADAIVSEVIKRIPAPRDGKDAEPVDHEAVVLDVLKRVPVPQDGKDGANGADGKDGAAGKDADAAAITAEVLERVSKMIPEPIHGKDGRDGLDGKDGRDGIDGKDGAPGAHGKNGADGIAGKDGADGLSGKDGRDGINGKDGSNGLDGKDGANGLDGKSITIDDVRPILEGEVAKWALDFERRAADVMQKAIDKIPRYDPPTSVTIEDVRPILDGEVAKALLDLDRRAADSIQKAIDNLPEPKPGKDGFTPDDLRLSLKEDGQTIVVTMSAGERVTSKELRLPIPVDAGVFKRGESYQKGQTVSYGGSLFIAQCETSQTPETGPDWRLAVKRGRDGK